jgi:hypothetical protein
MDDFIVYLLSADDRERVFDRYIADILFPNNAESAIKLTTRLDTMIEMCDEALLQLEEEQTSRLQVCPVVLLSYI